MAVTFSSGSQSPSSLSQSRTIDRVFEDAQHTGEINLSGRKLKEYPQSVAGKYDLVDTISAGECRMSESQIPCQQKITQHSSNLVIVLVILGQWDHVSLFYS